MVNIEIDGVKLQAEPGKMIIEVANKAKIPIPHFCYHPGLSIAANCRMCLVEVEKSRKPLPACATPVTEGMRVFTKSPTAIDAQRSVMEFLLINHPLDCPICDQGGECELQDVSMGYGDDISRFSEAKRAVDDENLGPLIATEMTRCIQCTRCVRFGEEIAGLRELGAVGRGEHMEIETFVNQSLVSELSGNIVDICPVGALTSKPYRFTARAWELTQHAGVAPHDCVGSHIYFHRRQQDIMRVVPKENMDVNEMWLADRDRFSYTSLASTQRVLKPKIKQAGVWQEVSWEEALQYVTSRLQKVIEKESPQSIGALISPSATLEEHYLWQKLWRALNVHNIDHRLRDSDTSAQTFMPLYPGLTCSLADLEKQDAFLIVGGYLRKEQPLLNHRLRKACLQNNAKACLINAIDYDYNFTVATKIVASPCAWVKELEGVLGALLRSMPENVRQAKISADLMTWVKTLLNIESSKAQQDMAAHLLSAQEKTLILGHQALHSPFASHLLSLLRMLAELTGAHLGLMTDGANSAGAWLAGSVPHRLVASQESPTLGLSTSEQFQQALKAYFLFQCEPHVDAISPGKAVTALKQADLVVAFHVFENEALRDYCDVILPINAFAENSGTFVNVCGDWQSFTAAVQPQAESKPGWKVLRVLANFLELNGFDYQTLEEIITELKITLPQNLNLSLQDFPQFEPSVLRVCAGSGEIKNELGSLKLLTEWPIYRIDSYVRESQVLQQAASQEACALTVHPQTAAKFGLKEGEMATLKQNECTLCLPVAISTRVMEGFVHVPLGYEQTAGIEDAYGAVNVIPSKAGIQE